MPQVTVLDIIKFTSQITRPSDGGNTYTAGELISGVSDEHFEIGNVIASDSGSLQSDDSIVRPQCYSRSAILNSIKLVRSVNAPILDLAANLHLFCKDLGDIADTTAISFAVADVRAYHLATIAIATGSWDTFGNGQSQEIQKIDQPIVFPVFDTNVTGVIHAYLEATNAGDMGASEVVDLEMIFTRN